MLLADLYEHPGVGHCPAGGPWCTPPAVRAEFHRIEAARLRAAILDLFWDPARLAFYDFNRTANARGTLFSAATFYPLWSGIVPPEVLHSEQKAFGVFAALNMVLNKCVACVRRVDGCSCVGAVAGLTARYPRRSCRRACNGERARATATPPS